MFKWINDNGCGIEFEKILFQKGYVTLKEVEDILKQIKEKK